LEVAYHPESPVKDVGALEKFTCIVEPDFGNKGFGRPDAILRFDCTTRRIVVIVEAKLTGFAEACWQPSRRGEPTFNSRLNGQLELDYRLAMALARFEEGVSVLDEANWVPQSPYGEARVLKKDSVVRTLVPQFSGEDLRLAEYYYLVVTIDEQNPFDGANEQFLPQLFKVEMEDEDLVFPDRWKELKSKFGWTNYREMAGLITKIEGQLPMGSLFLPTYAMYEMNKGVFGKDTEEDDNGHEPPPHEEDIVLKPPLWGKWIVEFGNELCHLSCQQYSYALRHLHRGRWTERERVKKGNVERNKREILSMLSRVRVIKKDSTSIKDIPYWERRFKELKGR